jgi:ATP-dependent DNA helicase DinG
MTRRTTLEQLKGVISTLPAGEVREGQSEMARAVAEALETGRHVSVAAGTGTGKSFAYLVPAVLSGKKVVVATATKALQEQLATKDLPLVSRGLTLGEGRSQWKWAVLKGRSNYLCRQRLAEMEQAARQATFEDLRPLPPAASGAPASDRGVARREQGPGAGCPEPIARAREPRAGRPLARTMPPARDQPSPSDHLLSIGDQVAMLAEWSATTTTGDRAELDFEPHPTAWSSVSVGSDECPGAHRCPSGADCFTELARAKASRADVVVVNLHLLGADLASGGAILPEHDALIVDEAHELEDVLAACLGADVGPGRLRGVAAGARAALGGSPGRRRGRRSPAGRASAGSRSPRDDGGPAVEAVMSAAGGFEEVLRAAAERRLPPGLGPDVGPAVELAVTRLTRLESELRAAGVDACGGADDGGQARVRSLLAVEKCREQLEACLLAEGDEVVWVNGGDRPSLRSAPLDVSAVMAAQVFGEMPTVLTSATLPPGLAVHLGAEPAEVTELDVGSPFDYQQNALLYCAVRLPDRRGPGSSSRTTDAVHDEIEFLVRAAGGRTLGLFTSWRAMTEAAGALRERIPWPIHAQGELPKPALLRAFGSEEEACLFATVSFWQGVDVPGPSLSLVVIDRLPFPRPDDPLISARRTAAGSQGFMEIDLPRAAIRLAQGAGRLIRTATDRGVVAVLDPRLATASYSGYLVRTLPPMRRTRVRGEAVAFLEAIRTDS